jgi:branched-chain amino acid transport system permease protein
MKHPGALFLWAALYALPLVVRSDFVLTIFIFTFIYGILAVTFDLIFGFTGQLSMFHPAVFGVSAYMTHLLVVRAGLPFWLATLPAALAAAALAVIVGSMCFKFRLKTFYFAVVTLAFAEMIRLVVMNWNSVTNGTLGLVVAGKPTIYWPGSGLVGIKGPVAWYYVTLVALSLTALICARVLASWMGRCFAAIRLNEDLARTLGVNVYRYKLLSFALGNALASFAGGLYGYYTGYIDPGYLGINQSMEVLAMVLLGGQGTLTGPIVGSLVLTGLPHAIDLTAEARAMLYGAILIFTILVMPRGIVGTLNAWRARRAA